MNTQIKKAISLFILALALANAVGTKQSWASGCPQDDCKLDFDTFSQCLPLPQGAKDGYIYKAIVQRAGGTGNPLGPVETDEYAGCLDCNGDCLKEGVYHRKTFFDCFTANANGDLLSVDVPADVPTDPPIKMALANGQVFKVKTIIGTTVDCQEGVEPLPIVPIPISITRPVAPIAAPIG